MQTAESLLQGNCIESPTTSRISEEETYVKLTTSTQDCNEGEFPGGRVYVLGLFWNTQTDESMFDFTELTEYIQCLSANHSHIQNF